MQDSDIPFSTKVVRDDDATVIYVQGEIDIASAGRLRDAIEPHMSPDQTIVLDLSGVEFMDSSCLDVLVKARGRLTRDGGSLILRNPSPLAHRVLTVLGVEFILSEDADEHPDGGKLARTDSALAPSSRMVKPCPECGGDLIDLEPEAEMGSRPVRYDCSECELTFETHPAGGLVEVD